MIVALAVLTAASATALVRWTQPGTDEQVAAPSDADTQALLLAKWEQALTAGKAAFCADAEDPDLCASYWDQAGGAAAVPRQKPRVVASNTSETYRWLTVCGTTALGRKYESEFVTTRDVKEGPVRIVLPVFWWTQRFRGVYTEGSQPTSTVPDGYPTLC